MPTREQIYTKQLKDLGIYKPAFDPMISDLGEAERQRQRAYKEWRAKAKKENGQKAKPSFESPLWPVIDGLDKKILAYREALGLTPKALRRLTGSPEPPVQQDLITERLNAIAERVTAYSVPKLNTGENLENDNDERTAF